MFAENNFLVGYWAAECIYLYVSFNLNDVMHISHLFLFRNIAFIPVQKYKLIQSTFDAK